MLLSVAAEAAESERLEAVARELLARLDMQVELRRRERIDLTELRTPPGPGESYFARVWIALGSSGRARLYLEHAASDRLLVREVGGEASNPELLREELGHILQAAVEGLKAGEAIGEPRRDALKEVEPDAPQVAPAPPTPRPRPPQSPKRAWPLRFGPRYEAAWISANRFDDGPGAVLELASSFGLELAGYYRRPKTISGDPVGVRLQTLALRALGEVQLWRGARARAQLGAGAGVDFTRVSPVTRSPGAADVPGKTWLLLAMGRVQASYARRTFDFLELEVNLGLDLDLSSTRYVFQTRTGEVPVLDPWRLRPTLSLGATVP